MKHLHQFGWNWLVLKQEGIFVLFLIYQYLLEKGQHKCLIHLVILNKIILHLCHCNSVELQIKLILLPKILHLFLVLLFYYNVLHHNMGLFLKEIITIYLFYYFYNWNIRMNIILPGGIESEGSIMPFIYSIISYIVIIFICFFVFKCLRWDKFSWYTIINFNYVNLLSITTH
jgi:hypothetical protein